MNRLVVKDGTLESLKWLALALMTGDHVNKYLFNSTIDWLYNAGRVALPLFVFVLAYNLARPGVLASGAHFRTIKRLLVFGVIASIPFCALGGLYQGWWPLNIMFTLAAITYALYLIEQKTPKSYIGAGMIVLIVGSSVEFWWPAIILGLTVWWFLKSPSWLPLTFVAVSLIGLGFCNGNSWALLAIPIVLAVSRLDLHLPRLRWAFYGFYPLHLAALWIIRIPMAKAGYLFF
jgi:hypothetical protein